MKYGADRQRLAWARVALPDLLLGDRHRPPLLLQVAELVLADLDLVAVGEPVRLDSPPVDVGAVERAEGFHVKAVATADQQRVITGDGRIANIVISWISGVKLKDYGCTLKAYRSGVLKDVRLYGEMHRFIPIYASWMGARTTEIPVRHHPRRAGASKYD